MFAVRYGSKARVLCMIVTALLWGGEYVVANDVLDIMEPNWSNAVRGFFTSIFAVIVWWKFFKRATPADWRRGLICGGLFGMGTALQIMGLELINAGINAFISSAYVIMVPFMVWFIEKTRPRGKVFVSALIAVVGISTMSITGFSTGNLSIGPGEILSLLSAIGYGGAIVAADYFTEKTSVEFITGCQFICTFVIGIVFALIMEQPPDVTVSVPVVLEFIYLILFGTFITQFLFTFGVKYASANQAGVIFPLESVSATVFGCLFLHEQLKTAQVIGGILIVAAIIISNITLRRGDGERLS